MCEAIDNGRMRIINKGVDVTVIAGSATAAEAMKASRTLVVKGISTAVIEVLTIEPLDKETLFDFAKKTKVFVFTEKWLYEGIKDLLLSCEPMIIGIVMDATSQNIINTAINVIKDKLCK